MQLMIELAQSEGKTCAWVDSENSWSSNWAGRLGVDNDNLIISQAKTVNQATKEVVSLMQSKIDIVVIDSISALIPGAFFGDKDELKDVNDSKQIGSLSRDLGIAIRDWNLANENTMLVLISQLRNSFSATYTSHIPDGGHAARFFSSTVIRLTASEAKADQIHGTVAVGDKLFQEPIGRPVKWTVENNKLGPQNKTGSYDLYYDGDFVGIDKVGEIFDYACKFDIVDTSSKGYFGVLDKTIHGRKAAITYLRENQAVLDTIEGELLAKIQ